MATPKAADPPPPGAQPGPYRRDATAADLRAITLRCDGRDVRAIPGETIATALLAAGVSALRRAERSGAPRGLFCGMGVCFECRVTVDGRANQRACMTPVASGMDVRTQGLRE